MSNDEGRVRPCAGCPSAWRLGKLCTSDASFDKVRRRRRRGRTLARFPLGNRGQPGAPPATATATSHGQQTKAILQDLIICSRQQQQLCCALVYLAGLETQFPSRAWRHRAEPSQPRTAEIH